MIARAWRFALVVLFFPGAAFGATPDPAPPVTVASQPGAPIQIRECYVAGFEQVAALTNIGNVYAHLSFENVTQSPIEAVKFQFDIFDSFDTKIATLYGTVAGTFSPNVLIEPQRVGIGKGILYSRHAPAWSFTLLTGSPPSGVSSVDIAHSMCSVTMVKRQDGTIWRADATP